MTAHAVDRAGELVVYAPAATSRGTQSFKGLASRSAIRPDDWWLYFSGEEAAVPIFFAAPRVCSQHTVKVSCPEYRSRPRRTLGLTGNRAVNFLRQTARDGIRCTQQL